MVLNYVLGFGVIEGNFDAGIDVENIFKGAFHESFRLNFLN